MARRVLVATAVLSGAQLIIADEPTPWAGFRNGIGSIADFSGNWQTQGKSVVLITHDIDLAFHIADRISVFYAGTTVETAKAADFFKRKRSP